MAEKMSMDIFIKDMKEQDARIESDMQTYAALLGNVEKHTRDLKKRKEEKEMLEQFLHRIGGERDSSGESVHIQTLEDLISVEEREIADNNNLIEEQQAYYEALSEKDYQTLWEQKEDKSAIAAICFAFEKWELSSESMVRKLSKTRNQLSEEVARYLLEKALVYSESKQESDDEAEDVDGLLSDILGRTDFPQSDAVWQNIEECLRIRKTQRTLAKCNDALRAWQGQKRWFESFEKDYADNYREILAEIKGLEKQKIGKEVDAAVKGTKEWFSEQTAELENQIKRRRSEAAIIENHLQTLQSMYTELENGMGTGIQTERCDAICNAIRDMEDEKVKIVDAYELDNERRQLLKDYQEHLKTVKAAKDAEVEREKENQRQRVRSKADRKRKFIKSLPFLAVGAAALIFYMYCGRNVYHGTGKVYFGNGRFKNYKVAEGVEEIPEGLFEGNQSMESITLPESLTKIYGSAFEGCTSLEEIVIPESVTSIGGSAFKGCTSLEEIVIPESVTSIGGAAFKDCTSLQRVELHSSTLSLGIGSFEDCGSLIEIRNEGNIENFEELLSRNDSVLNCCNLDMSEVYDNLYSNAINGVPLLENQVQLKNLLDQMWIPYGEGTARKFDPVRDILTDASFGTENVAGDSRSVDFSFKLKHRGLVYTFEGAANSGLEEPKIEVELSCTNIGINELLQQLSADDENTILEMIAGQSVLVNGVNVELNKDEITILESELAEGSEAKESDTEEGGTEENEAGEGGLEETETEEGETGESWVKYTIPLKLKVDKPLGEVTLLGSIQLSEQDAFVPKLIFTDKTADIDLLGTYISSPEDGEESVLTIDKQYERCYSVTQDGEKQMLVMDMEGLNSKLIRSRNGDVTVVSVSLSADRAGISIGEWDYYKTGSGVSDTMPEDITPFAGVWQGTYKVNTAITTIKSRQYILPVGENDLAVVNDFEVEELNGGFDIGSGTFLGVLNYDPQSGSCVIDYQRILAKSKGLNEIDLLRDLEGEVNDSYDRMVHVRGTYHPFTLTKTKPDNNTLGIAAGTDNFSIYTVSGNVKKELTEELTEELLMKVPPADAFEFNGSKYYIYHGFKTWEEAEAYCEAMGGHLAFAESDEEREALHSYITGQSYTKIFLGGSYDAMKETWRWEDGGFVDKTKWGEEKPNEKTIAESHIMFYYAYSDHWNALSINFSGIEGFLCEWDDIHI